MAQVREGGCACGAVRFRATGAPVRVVLCACRACQTRTGSVVGHSVYVREDNVVFTDGVLVSRHYTSDAGRPVETRFCPTCGTTLTWTMDFMAGLRGLAGGAFDDPADLPPPDLFSYAGNRPDWLTRCGEIPAIEGMPG